MRNARQGTGGGAQYLGLYAPELTMARDGEFAVVQWPEEMAPHE